MKMSQPVFDDFVNDPQADTVFKSASGKHYRISNWVLAKQSSFFQDLRSLPLRATTEPFEIDIHDDLLRAILRSANFDEPITNAFDCAQLRLNVFIVLYDFFARWQFNEATIKLDLEIARRADTDPWTLLFEASRYDALDYAILAVEKLHANRIITVKFWTNIGKLRPEWQAPFLFAVFDIQARHEPIPGTFDKINVPFAKWSCKYQSGDLAKRFKQNVITMEATKKASSG